MELTSRKNTNVEARDRIVANAPRVVDHVYWVVPGVIAGRPSPECVPWDVHDLVEAGFGGVVSLDGPIKTKDLRLAGLTHLAVHRPMLLLRTVDDHRRFLSAIPRILPFVDEMRARGRATLVHCYYGCDRTGTALACYLVARENYTAEQAIVHVQHVKPDAMWAVGYMEAVHTFESMYRADPSLFEAARVG